MITKDELFVAGKVTRTHGVTGEWVCIGTTDVLDECPYVVLCMDGLFVPFFIESRRYHSQTAWLIKVEGIENEEKARNLVGKEVFLPKKWQEEAAQVSYHYFIDFTVYNYGERVGRIESINDQTDNVLFSIVNDERLYMVPAVEDFMVQIDHANKQLFMELPEGLLTIND